jgi:hypothetical protein
MEEIIGKLEQFIRKYYKNKILKGGLVLSVLLILLILSLSIIEFFGWFGTTLRAIFFFSFIIISSGFLWVYILVPVFRLLGLREKLSYESAAQIIGKHFPGISDQLLNVLQLKSKLSDDSSALLLAAINQKSKHLHPFKFSRAVSYRDNRKSFRWFIIATALFAFIIFINPSLISEPTRRITNFNKEYVKPAPFEFIIVNKNLTTTQNSDFELRVKTIGDEMPEEVFLISNGLRFKMEKADKNVFTYDFIKLKKDNQFYLSASMVESKTYTINVIPKPMVKGI